MSVYISKLEKMDGSVITHDYGYTIIQSKAYVRLTETSGVES